MITIFDDIKKIDNIDALEKKYEEFCYSYSHKPDRNKFPYPKVGEVLDENKSVKWNKEEVERFRKVHDDEVKRRNQEYNAITNAYENRFKELFAEDYGIKVSESELIWSYAYSEGHSGGIYNVVAHFRDVASLYIDLLKVHRKRQ